MAEKMQNAFWSGRRAAGKEQSPPVHTSPAPCGKFVGSESAWPGSRSAPLSCRHQRRQWPPPRPLQLPIRLLSPARPRPPPAACCPVASAEDPEAPPPGRRGYWALWRTGGDDMKTMILHSPQEFYYGWGRVLTIFPAPADQVNSLKYGHRFNSSSLCHKNLQPHRGWQLGRTIKLSFYRFWR